MNKGTIVFTETGFVLTTNSGDIEVYQKSEIVSDKYVVFDGVKYKWVNQPKRADVIIEDEYSDEEE